MVDAVRPTNMEQVVLGAPRQPFPYGLFSVVEFRHEEPERWLNGVRFREDFCCGLDGYDYGCEVVPDKSSTDAGGQNVAYPFIVYARTKCMPGGLNHEEREADVLKRFLNREQTAVESQLWSGQFSTTTDYIKNTCFYEPSLDPRVALAHAEDWISGTYGSLGIIHMSRGTAALMPLEFIHHESRVYTQAGTPVILGSGYPKGYVGATPNIFGYRSPEIKPTSGYANGMDFRNNVRYAMVERAYLLGFDDCGTYVAGISVNGVDQEAPVQPCPPACSAAQPTN